MSKPAQQMIAFAFDLEQESDTIPGHKPRDASNHSRASDHTDDRRPRMQVGYNQHERLS